MAVWDRWARVYDCQLLLERRALAAGLDLLAPGSADRLLDVGTGTGALLRLLAARSPRPARATGVDASRAMLDRAGTLPPGWALERADAVRLPFADASFDSASLAYLLHLLDRATRATVLVEVRRVLRRGGRLLTVTPIRPRGLPGLMYDGVLRGLGRVSADLSRSLAPLDPRPEIAAAGFVVEGTSHVRLGYPSLCVVAHRDHPDGGARAGTSAFESTGDV